MKNKKICKIYFYNNKEKQLFCFIYHLNFKISIFFNLKDKKKIL